jgi:SpoVK/Ycf46/Vps4 family AAA+-type ATPase
MTSDDSLDCLPPQVHCLIELARVNYQREVRCEPLHMLPLNRLFLGNPGTGKTSIAKVYGRILKGLGYLSDGSVEVRTPSDLIASAVGGTEEKTAAAVAAAAEAAAAAAPPWRRRPSL